MSSWELFIPGEPVARAEKRVTFYRNGRPIGGLADKPKQKDYKAFVKSLIALNKPEELLSGALSVSLSIGRSKPKSVPKKQKFPITKPDLTNYIKLFEDCLKGLVIRDDAQIVEMTATKHYTDSPGVKCEISVLE